MTLLVTTTTKLYDWHQRFFLFVLDSCVNENKAATQTSVVRIQLEECLLFYISTLKGKFFYKKLKFFVK